MDTRLQQIKKLAQKTRVVHRKAESLKASQKVIQQIRIPAVQILADVLLNRDWNLN